MVLLICAQLAAQNSAKESNKCKAGFNLGRVEIGNLDPMFLWVSLFAIS
jgi:hypothetical protein